MEAKELRKITDDHIANSFNRLLNVLRCEAEKGRYSCRVDEEWFKDDTENRLKSLGYQVGKMEGHINFSRKISW